MIEIHEGSELRPAAHRCAHCGELLFSWLDEARGEERTSETVVVSCEKGCSGERQPLLGLALYQAAVDACLERLAAIPIERSDDEPDVDDE